MKTRALLMFLCIILISSCKPQPKNTDPEATVQGGITQPIPSVSSTDPIGIAENSGSGLYFVGESEPSISFEWLSDHSFRYTTDKHYDGQNANYSYTEVSIEESDGKVTLLPGKQYEQVFFLNNYPFQPVYSDSQKQFIFETEIKKPTVPVIIDDGQVTDRGVYTQYYLFSQETGAMDSLFATNFEYYLEWLPDEEHVMMTCSLGDYSRNGIYVIDIKTREIVTLSDSFCYFEFLIQNEVSPDSKYILINGGLQALAGGEMSSICKDDEEYTAAQTWSDDSSTAYAFCRPEKSERLGVLRRINVETKIVSENILEVYQNIKINEMAVSPDQKWLLFQWKDKSPVNSDNRGLWLAKLK